MRYYVYQILTVLQGEFEFKQNLFYF